MPQSVFVVIRTRMPLPRCGLVPTEGVVIGAFTDEAEAQSFSRAEEMACGYCYNVVPCCLNVPRNQFLDHSV